MEDKKPSVGTPAKLPYELKAYQSDLALDPTVTGRTSSAQAREPHVVDGYYRDWKTIEGGIKRGELFCLGGKTKPKLDQENPAVHSPDLSALETHSRLGLTGESLRRYLILNYLQYHNKGCGRRATASDMRHILTGRRNKPLEKAKPSGLITSMLARLK